LKKIPFWERDNRSYSISSKDRVSTCLYKSISDLPKPVREPPAEARTGDIQEASTAHGYEYADPDKRRGHDSQEEVAYKIGLAAAVKHQYAKKAKDGDWHRK